MRRVLGRGRGVGVEVDGFALQGWAGDEVVEAEVLLDECAVRARWGDAVGGVGGVEDGGNGERAGQGAYESYGRRRC